MSPNAPDEQLSQAIQRLEGLRQRTSAGVTPDVAGEWTRSLDDLRTAAAALHLRGRALEAAANVVVMTDRQGNITWANPAFTRLTGYSLAEVLGQNSRILKSGRHDAVFYRHLWETILSGRVWQGEFANLRKDGSLFYEEATITPVRDAAGEITHFIAVKADITARKQSERLILETNDQLQTIFQASPLPIVLLDLEGKIRQWNAAAVKTFGWSASEVAGQEPPFVPAAGREEHHRWCQRVLRGEVIQGGELVKCLKRDGTALDFLLSAAPLHDPNGLISGILALYLDITEKASLEAQLLRAQRLESIGHLASGIAHDLNNVLSPMIMAGPLLRGEITTPIGRAMLNAVETSAKRGADIVKQILIFSRGLKADKVPVQTRHLLRETSQIVQETFPKSIRVKISFPRELWLVEGNSTLLHQVLMNLAINARDAMPDGGLLTLAGENLLVTDAEAAGNPLARRGPHVAWTISDTGIGIPKENLGRIFEAFFTTKPLGQGTGLGLHTVAGIIRDHGGFIKVESQVGKGSSFKVFLPATLDLAAPEAATTQALPQGHGECILVVDDEETIRTILQAMLEQNGYRVLLAAGGGEALKLFQQHRAEIGLILTDLAMPLMSGAVFIRAALKLAPRVKIVVITGATEDVVLSELAEIEVDAVLAKPADCFQMLSTLAKVLRAEPRKRART